METNGIKTGYCPGEHRCMECGEPLGEYGRSDRKFCSPHCKDGYNNRKRHYLRGVRMRVETALSRNHSILERLLEEGRTSAQLADLVQMGFKTDYVSSFRKAGGRDVVWCYDIKYVLTPTKVMRIERLSSVL
ncbi:MAG: hypothetical protein IJL61_05575 [Bacteroidales bacterium]|nr:hypothetical protein [Bacteroidales bacterium]